MMIDRAAGTAPWAPIPPDLPEGTYQVRGAGHEATARLRAGMWFTAPKREDGALRFRPQEFRPATLPSGPAQG